MIKPLTAREQEILFFVVQGRSSKEIAAALGVSIRTVEGHRARFMLKLGYVSITDLVRYAVRNKIIDA